MVVLMIEDVDGNLAYSTVDIAVVAEHVGGIAGRAWRDAGDPHSYGNDGVADYKEETKGEACVGY